MPTYNKLNELTDQQLLTNYKGNISTEKSVFQETTELLKSSNESTTSST